MLASDHLMGTQSGWRDDEKSVGAAATVRPYMRHM